MRYRLKMGNRANHSTAKDIRPKTCELVSRREASKTEAKIAALVDREPGNLVGIRK